MLKNKNKGFSLVELIVVIAILVVFAAVLIPSLLQYTENSRAQKDESAMDEVVNAFQLALADEECFDEALLYSCTNNYITYSDSSGNYGQQINDGEFWAPDGYGKATTVTFNPETGANGDTVYDISKALVNDMTYGNGSVAQSRIMEGSLIEDNQCYLSRLEKLYNTVRQAMGKDVFTTSQTYRNSSFTVFIKFNQKDGITVADVNGAFNGTNLYEGAEASKGSGTSSYDEETGDAITSVQVPGRTESNYTDSDLMGSVTLSGNTTEYGASNNIDTSKGIYYVGVTSNAVGNYSGATAIYKNGEFPSESKSGDVYVLGDYEYRLDRWCTGSNTWEPINNSNPHWSVRVIDTTKQEYGAILANINGRTVASLSNTFKDCVNMKQSPEIPRSIVGIDCAFYNCVSLQEAPIIEDHIMKINSTFYGCKSLSGTIIVNTDLPQGYNKAFKNTQLRIDLAGKSTKLKQLAATDGYSDLSTKDNVRVLNIIPEGGVYYVGVTSNILGDYSGATATYTAGQLFPSTVKNGDVYVYGDYEYRYNYHINYLGKVTEWGDTTINGWGVRVLDSTKTQYGDILNSINNQPIKSLSQTFAKCNKMTRAPQMPSTVTNVFSIFYSCTKLEIAPVFPSGAKSLTQVFSGCTSLITYENATPGTQDYDFSKYVISASVVQTNGMFGSTKIQYAPVIPKGVTNMTNMFQYCLNLTGTIEINANPTSFSGCFKSTTKSIILTGTSTKLNEIAATATNGNVTVQQ